MTSSTQREEFLALLKLPDPFTLGAANPEEINIDDVLDASVDAEPDFGTFFKSLNHLPFKLISHKCAHVNVRNSFL